MSEGPVRPVQVAEPLVLTQRVQEVALVPDQGRSRSSRCLPLAVSAVIVLQLLNLIAVPLWAGQVVSGASISAVTILKDLLLLVLIPLAIGLAVRWRYPDHAKGWQPELVKVANLALGLALIAGIAVNWSTIVSLLGSRVLLASLVVVIVSLAAGYFVGGRDAPARASTGLVTGVRFTALGLIIIGTQLHANRDYLGPAIVFALVELILVDVGSHGMPHRLRRVAPPAVVPCPDAPCRPVSRSVGLSVPWAGCARSASWRPVPRGPAAVCAAAPALPGW